MRQVVSMNLVNSANFQANECALQVMRTLERTNSSLMTKLTGEVCAFTCIELFPSLSFFLVNVHVNVCEAQFAEKERDRELNEKCGCLCHCCRSQE